MQAPKFIIVHNHPSGDPTPSDKDLKFTNQLYDASEIMGIELVDHIVLGNECFKSIFEETMKG